MRAGAATTGTSSSSSGDEGAPPPSWLHPDEEEAGNQVKEELNERTPLAAPPSKASSKQPPGSAIINQEVYLRAKDVKRGFVLSLFILINVVTVFSALSVAAAEVLSIIYHDLTYQAIALRVYGIIFCIVVIFAELGWTQAVRDTVIIQNWFTRGAFYVFVGLLALEEEQEKTAIKDLVNLYIFAAGLGLIGLGVLYSLMGICCCKRVFDHRAAKYRALRSQAELQEAVRVPHVKM